jgi:uncharacterized protein YoxC
MEIMLYIAAIIAAIAFVVLVVYAVITLKATKQTLNDVSGTLQGLEKQMQGVTSETTQLLNKTNRLADDINHKSTKLDGLFEGAKGVGDTVNDFNQTLRQLSSIISRNSKEDQEKAAQAVKWGASIFEYWNKRKSK